MSTLKVDAIRHNSATSDAITTVSDGTCTARLTSIGGGGLSHRNLILNGRFDVFQRYLPGSQVVVNNGNNNYCMDRWYGRGEGSKGVFTFIQQDIQSDAQGAHAAARVNVTTTSTPSTNDVYKVAQRIEGANVRHLHFGTSSAKTITLSFLTKSSVTGTHGGSLMNSAQNRAYPFTYTISSANTWEQKSITIPGDTGGTWVTNTGIGLELNFDMGTAESNYRRPAGSWYAGRAEGADGAVQLITQSGADWYVTKVQLEIGDTATSFEHRSYGDELARCQRYYTRLTGGGGNELHFTGSTKQQQYVCCSRVELPTTMRTAPSISFTGTRDILFYSNDNSGFSGDVIDVNSFNVRWGSSTTISDGTSYTARLQGTPNYVECSAEL